MATPPPTDLDKLYSAWARLQRFVNHDLVQWANRSYAVRYQATGGRAGGGRRR